MSTFTTENRILTFNTRIRDRTRYPDPADCMIEFPDPYRMVTKITLTSHGWPSVSRNGIRGVLIRKGENDSLEFCEGLRVGSGNKFSTSFWVTDVDDGNVAGMTNFPHPWDPALEPSLNLMASLPAYYNPINSGVGGKHEISTLYPHAMFPQSKSRQFFDQRGANVRLKGGSRSSPLSFQFSEESEPDVTLIIDAFAAGTPVPVLHTLPLTKKEISDTVNAHTLFRATLHYEGGRFVFRLKQSHSSTQKIQWPTSCNTIHCLEVLGFRNGQRFDASGTCRAIRRPQYHFRARIAENRWAEYGAANFRHALLQELNKGSLLAANGDPSTSGETVQANAVVANMPVEAQKQAALGIVYSDGDVRPLRVGIYQRFRTPTALADHLTDSWESDPAVQYEEILKGINMVKPLSTNEDVVQIKINDNDPSSANVSVGDTVRLIDLDTKQVRYGLIASVSVVASPPSNTFTVTDWYLDSDLSIQDFSPKPEWYTKTDEENSNWQLTVFHASDATPIVTYDAETDKFSFKWSTNSPSSLLTTYAPVSLTFNPDLIRPTISQNMYDNNLSRQLAGMLGVRAGATYQFVRQDSGEFIVTSEYETRWPRYPRTWSPNTELSSVVPAEDAATWFQTYEYPMNAYRFAYSGSNNRPHLSILSDAVVFRGNGQSNLNATDWIRNYRDFYSTTSANVATSDSSLYLNAFDIANPVRSASLFNPGAMFEILHEGVSGSIGRRIGLNRDFVEGANRVEMSRTYDSMGDQNYMVTLQNVPSVRQSAEVIVYDPKTDRQSGKASVVAIVPTNQGWSYGATPANSLTLYDPANVRKLHIRLMDQSGTRTYSTNGQDITYSFVFTMLVPTGNR